MQILSLSKPFQNVIPRDSHTSEPEEEDEHISGENIILYNKELSTTGVSAAHNRIQQSLHSQQRRGLAGK